MNPLQWHRKRTQAGLSVVSEAILDVISQIGSMPVMPLISHAVSLKISSPATAHTALRLLTASGFVKIAQTKDHRVKICTITQKGRTYLSATKGKQNEIAL
jgi:predicted transcriptional regulator